MTVPPDPLAADLLVHAGFVRAVARATLRGDADVEDVVQETWVAALQSGPRPGGSLRAWLGGVVRRQGGAPPDAPPAFHGSGTSGRALERE